MDGAGFTAPMVLPGTYTVKLILNDKEYLSKVNCIHDTENPDLNETDRKNVYENATKLKGLYENVNHLIDSVSFYKISLKTDSVAFNKNKAQKLFYGELEKIRAELMGTKKTSIFADEERLREKISSLYGTFCGMESKPNSTQLEAIEVLQSDYKKQLEIYTVLMTKNRKTIIKP